MELPRFKYHPDPIATGSVEKSDETCACCKKARGYIYTGPVYAEDELDDQICPWCIADGSAHKKFDASFNDADGVGGYGDWDEVPERVMQEIAFRTPGFAAWQQPRWWTHCEDGAEFLGVAGHKELVAFGPQAVEAIRANVDLPPGPEWDALLKRFSKDSAPTAYVFRCRKCGQLGGYHDFD